MKTINGIIADTKTRKVFVLVGNKKILLNEKNCAYYGVKLGNK